MTEKKHECSKYTLSWVCPECGKTKMVQWADLNEYPPPDKEDSQDKPPEENKESSGGK